MKIIADAKQFVAAFNSVSGAVPSRTPKDVLMNVLVIPQDGGLMFVGDDMEASVSHFLADVTIEGDAQQFLIPHKRASQVLKDWRSEEITLVLDDGKLKMSGVGAKFQFLTSDPKEFPPTPVFDATAYWKVPASVFATAVRRTVFATEENDKRYSMGGVNLQLDGNMVAKFCSTDTRRLSLFTAAVEVEGEPEAPEGAIIIPPKSLALVLRNINSFVENVDVAFSGRTVLLRVDDTVVTSRLIEGRFPKYEAIIPKSCEMNVEIPAGILTNAVRQAMVFTAEETAAVAFHFGDDSLRLTSAAAGAGESEIVIPVAWGSQQGIEVRLDPANLLQMLKVLKPEDMIEVGLQGENQHLVFRVGDSYTYLMAPIAVG